MVYGVCRAMLRDVHEAEDAMQQVFLSAYTAVLGGAAVRDAGAWLATIARNECRGRIRVGMRTRLPVDDVDLDALPSTVDETERRAQVEALRAALSSLPDRQRQAAVLRYLYGLRYGEVATALGLSRPATEALLFRARRALHGTLRPVAGTALAVPVAVRDELALALPGFSEGAGSGVVAAGAAGGLLAKLTAGPAGMKVAAAAAAVSTVGVVGAVESDRSDPGPIRPAIVASRPAAVDRAVEGRSGAAPARHGGDDAPGGDHVGGSGVEVSDDRSGPGDGAEGPRSGSRKGREGASSSRGREDDRSSGTSGHGDAEGRDHDGSTRPASGARDDGGAAGDEAEDTEGREGEPSSAGSSEFSDSFSSAGSAFHSSGSSDSSGSDSSGSGSASSGPDGGSDEDGGHGPGGDDAGDESS